MRTRLLYAPMMIGVLALLAAPAGAGQKDLFEVAGLYALIEPPAATEAADKVEVVELFWYGCPHCLDFEPFIVDWQKSQPEYVEFRRMPAIFQQSWQPHARAYYTAEILGVVDQIHLPLFEAIHTHRRSLLTKDELMAFFAEHGVDEAAFSSTYDSFTVDTLVKRAQVMQARYGVMGVPAVVVNGKYRTSGNDAGGLERVMDVVDVLAEHEHRARRVESPAKAD